MQISTERGLISVTKEEPVSKEFATENGYSYSFTSRQLGCDLYSKITDSKGYCRDFLLVK